MRRRDHHPVITLPSLLAVQLAGFVAVELAERATTDLSTAAHLSPDTLAALVLQLPIAVVVFRLCRRAVAAVARLVARRTADPAPRAPRPVPTPATVHRALALHWALAAGRRGPPRGRLAH
jgi:hypothetical protein